MAGIYIHIPFCKVKCHYCDFHFSTKLEGKSKLVHSLLHELKIQQQYLIGQNIETLYFGGGTPSLLSKDEVAELIACVKENYTLTKDAEVTFECNPDDLTIQKLNDLKAAGINRLSIGTQSFNNDLLQFMNRAHNSNEAIDSIVNAQSLGFKNITIDLIYGVPGSSMELWKEELNQLEKLNVPHLSAYCLTIEEGTVFGSWKKSGKLKPFADEGSLSQFEYLLDYTKEKGYEQYEISNFAKQGFISKHNSAYWLGKHYLGIGPSAHSYNGDQRQWNVAHNIKYVNFLNKGESFFEVENLTTSDKFNDYILTRLRTKWGVSIEDLNAISNEKMKEALPIFTNHLDKENLILSQGVYTLTRQGKFIADAISADLFQ